MSKPNTPTPCSCGSRNKCETRAIRRPVYPPAPGRGDPAEHFARVPVGQVTWRLRFYADLWQRDGAGSSWHALYWAEWSRCGAWVSEPPPIDTESTTLDLNCPGFPDSCLLGVA